MMGVRSLLTVLLCLFAFLNVEVLASNQQLTIADIPACGLQCLFVGLEPSGCAATDIGCICDSTSLEYALATCLLANCTMQDSLGVSRVQADLCHLSSESKTQQVILYTGIVYSIAFVSVALRIAGKLLLKRLAWDDAVVVAALLLTAIPVACVLQMALHGFGQHLWDLGDGKLKPILLYLYVSWSTYVVVLCMIKVSLILFYIEIFRTPQFLRISYIFLAYMILNTLIILFIVLFACKPVNSFWDRDIKGECINIQAMAYAASASALVQDLVLLILPIAFIRNLQMKRFRKVAVGFMFCIGTFGCIATIMRLPSLSTFKISIDPSWDYSAITIWTELELCAGFLCVSLPSIRMLLVRLLPQRVRDFTSSLFHSLRSKPTPRPVVTPEQRSWKKPSSWIDISANSTDFSTSSSGDKNLELLTLGPDVRGSFMSAFWNRRSTSGTQLSQLSHLRSGSLRLESVTSNITESRVAVKQVEMLDVPKANRYTKASVASQRSDEEHITALPHIGCISETTRSGLEVRIRDERRYKGLHTEKNMV
ncbi:hypothetical protein HBI73_205670 [Parastagonospora nodorum]|nr:hypothetical protein HBH50_180890 [Parastagonospora nodorum]KAH4087374.1 hypothetical protein HBH48_131200 [Parastagonospora nodorum]KAH4216518.1 hypothetical protein HBI06_229280 [Parastagonospora nodorum]KAH4228356.1 hypothetical protein HBI05_207690 [Parastagonospora nodorum]KAH5061808.1 hypothetical protein HBI73_205670 [Parastagonospora nodorum]